jgi:hypothetical protein
LRTPGCWSSFRHALATPVDGIGALRFIVDE